jgi:competence protein ComEA
MNARITKSLHRVALALSLLGPTLVAHAQSAATGARPPAPAAQRPLGQPSSTADGVINLNTASSQELTRLPNIGPARAQAILELRQKLGGFKKVEDIMRVKGIGRKTFRKLEPMLRLQGTTTLTAHPGPRPGAH